MRFWKNLSIWALGFLVTFHSCKEKDEQFPAVTIAQPSNGTTYQVYDTVRVSYSASDENELVSVIAQLLNQNQIPIGAQAIADLNGNFNSSTLELPITDKLTASGTYYVLVKAFDGTNEQRKFVQIYINALPKKRRAIYVASYNENDAQLWKIDSLFQVAEMWRSAGQDVLKLQVNSLDDKLSVAGRFSTRLATYELASRTVLWEDQTFPVSQTERFLDLFGFENTLYTSLYDREVRAYSNNGALVMNRPTGDHRPETIYADATFLLVEMNLVGDNRHFIYVYNRATQALLWQTELPIDIVAICHLQQDEVLVFGNANGQSRVFHFDMRENSYWEPRQLPTGVVLTATKMNGLQFAISHSNGIYAYTYSPNYLNLIKAGNVYQDVCFDVDNGTLVAANGSMLEQLTINGQTIGALSLSDSIVSVDIHYTR